MRTDPEAACGSKQAYSSRKAAADAAKRMSSTHPGRFHAYPCIFCPPRTFHIGHLSRGELRRRNPRQRSRFAVQ